MARLLWRDAQGIEGSIDLASTEIRIGRAMDCAIRTDDAMVSRHHSRVFWGGGGYILEDLQSANGVYFQEQRVQSHMFKHGDAVRCGSLWLRFVDITQAAGGTGTGTGSGSGEALVPQHHGMGSVVPVAPTGHVSALGAQPQVPPPLAPPPPVAPPPPPVSAGPSESDIEIKVLRRRLEQLQTELKIYRTNKFNQDTARRMEDLENDLSMIEIERDSLKSKLERAEQQMTLEAGSVKVRRALEIAAATAETAASLNDLLSSLRIEVMAAEGEFDQYSHTIPRASFELIRQSLRES
ncbi:MAG: FHA domain-containing protein, partial [Kofleriaceae bacterium]